MKVIVAGTRDFDDYELLKEKLKTYDITEVVCGGAKGADTLGENYAKECEISVDYFPADWNKYGKAAGHIRNGDMAEYCDMAVIFWDGESKGSQDMIQKMRNIKKPCYIIRYNDVNFDESEW